MPSLSSAVRNTAPRRISKHYSDDLAGVVGALLDKDPRKRPTAREFLGLPVVAARMHFAPSDEETPTSPQAHPRAGGGLIATIKVPYGFGVPGMYGALCCSGASGCRRSRRVRVRRPRASAGLCEPRTSHYPPPPPLPLTRTPRPLLQAPVASAARARTGTRRRG